MAKRSEDEKVRLCDYGCGNKAKFQFKNGKWCCSKKYNSCKKAVENVRIRYQDKTQNPMFGRKHTSETIEKMRRDNLGEKNPMWGKKASKKTKDAVSKALKGRPSHRKLTIKTIKKRYPLFSKIEEMRYNPDKVRINDREIQVHCKNHECSNSKEKEGWFTPTYNQLYERIRQIEKEYGQGGCYFYCSDECKNICPLYNLHSDPYKEIETLYTNEEYQTFRKYVLERDDYVCQYCGKIATDVHHERPQKLEPFFALDPDYAWACCKKCHYEKGHSGNCSTGKLAKKRC